jgi:hypothetical protein
VQHDRTLGDFSRTILCKPRGPCPGAGRKERGTEYTSPACEAWSKGPRGPPGLYPRAHEEHLNYLLFHFKLAESCKECDFRSASVPASSLPLLAGPLPGAAFLSAPLFWPQVLPVGHCLIVGLQMGER